VKRFLGILVALSFVIGTPLQVSAQTKSGPVKVKKEYRFVMIPILVQAWFDIVHNASKDAADKRRWVRRS